MKAKVIRIITSLLELQSKGYFNISLDYEGDSFNMRIYKGKLDLHNRPVYHKSIDLNTDGESKLDEVFNMVEALTAVPTKATNNVRIVSFQCYKTGICKGRKIRRMDKDTSNY
jgi:hypothetical protein